MKRRLSTWTSLLLLTCGLAACGGSSSRSDNGEGNDGPPPPADSVFDGQVLSANQPVAGAAVWVYAAGAGGEAPTLIGEGQTAGDGRFGLAGFQPAPQVGQIVYVIARGGDAGGGANSTTALMTVAGVFCQPGPVCAFAESVTINERTTAAAVFSLARFIDPEAEGLGLTGTPPGPTNAAAVFARLVDAETGVAAVVADESVCGGAPEPANCQPLRKLHALANLVAACVRAGADAAACTDLLDAAGQAGDTLAALHNVVTDVAVRNNGQGLFALRPAHPPYAPALAAAPNDWTLALTHTGGGLAQPAGLAVDAAGNIWVANSALPGGSVTKLAPDGTSLSPAEGFTGGGLNGPIGIAVDGFGNVWVANWAQGSGKSVTKLAANGMALSPAEGFIGGGLLGPIDIAVSLDGIWVANYSNASLTLLDLSGTPVQQITGGGMSFPTAVAVDAANNVWVANQGTATISEFNADETPVVPMGYAGGGLTRPYGLALDADGDVWVANTLGESVSKFIGGNTPPGSCPPMPEPGDTGCPVDRNGFTGGGLKGPNEVAIDGAGRVWVSNFPAGSVSLLGNDGAPLSPAIGYQSSGLAQPYGIAVDPSGNVWVTNFAGDSVTQFIGGAEPVITPLLGLPQAP